MGTLTWIPWDLYVDGGDQPAPVAWRSRRAAFDSRGCRKQPVRAAHVNQRDGDRQARQWGPAVRRWRCVCVPARAKKAQPAPAGTIWLSPLGPRMGLRREGRQTTTPCCAVLTGRSELVAARRIRLPVCKRFRCLWTPAVLYAVEPAHENSTPCVFRLRHYMMPHGNVLR